MSHVDPPVTRVNKEMLKEYINMQVRFVGKVAQTRNPENPKQLPVAVLYSTDLKDKDEPPSEVEIRTLNPSLYKQGDIVEVVGTVSNDGESIRENNNQPPTSLSENFDMNNYDKMVQLSLKYKTLFT